jgi:hypothetical protein
MGQEILDNIYKVKNFESNLIENSFSLGKITEKEKFRAAKQILLGLAILYVLTLIAYMIKPIEGNKLLDICTTTFPPLATIILVNYFRNKSND